MGVGHDRDLACRPLLGADVEELFWPAFVRALEGLGTAEALATLRAMSAVGAGMHGRRARGPPTAWPRAGCPSHLGLRWSVSVRPIAAQLMYEQAFDDGVGVTIECAAADDDRHTLGIYIDHNLGGLVKNAFLAGPLGEVRAQFSRRGANKVGLALRELDLGEARARVESALEILDHTYAMTRRWTMTSACCRPSSTRVHEAAARGRDSTRGVRGDVPGGSQEPAGRLPGFA